MRCRRLLTTTNKQLVSRSQSLLKIQNVMEYGTLDTFSANSMTGRGRGKMKSPVAWMSVAQNSIACFPANIGAPNFLNISNASHILSSRSCHTQIPSLCIHSTKHSLEGCAVPYVKVFESPSRDRTMMKRYVLYKFSAASIPESSKPNDDLHKPHQTRVFDFPQGSMKLFFCTSG